MFGKLIANLHFMLGIIAFFIIQILIAMIPGERIAEIELANFLRYFAFNTVNALGWLLIPIAYFFTVAKRQFCFIKQAIIKFNRRFVFSSSSLMVKDMPGSILNRSVMS